MRTMQELLTGFVVLCKKTIRILLQVLLAGFVPLCKSMIHFLLQSGPTNFMKETDRMHASSIRIQMLQRLPGCCKVCIQCDAGCCKA